MKCRSHNEWVVAIALVFFCSGQASAEASDPIAVVSGGMIANPRQPQAAVGEDGAIYVAFGAGQAVYCSASMDGGESYRDPVQVGTVERLALGMRRGPRIAASGKTVVIAAVSHETGNVLCWRSTDRGRTWSEPVRVNDSSTGTANEGLHALAASPNGDVYCVWLDHRLDRKNQIFGAASSDAGATWSENRLIYRSPSGNVCECCHPSVAFDRKGKLFVMWRNSLNGFRDMYFASSADGGETFGEAVKLGHGSWKLDACPMDGGYLAAGVRGQVTTVWRRERQVIAADASGEERPLAIGEQPWAAGTADGVWIVWLSRRGGDLWLASPSADDPILLSSNATDPVVSASADGNGPTIAVWETGAGRDVRLMAQVFNR